MIDGQPSANLSAPTAETRSSFRRRLAFRQSMLVLSIAFALGLIAACVQIYTDHSRQMANIDLLSTKQLASVKEAATNALVELNEDLAAAITKGLLGHEMFMAAKLETPSGYVLSTQSREIMTGIRAEISHYLFGQPEQQRIDLTFDDGANTLEVGRLIVVVDTCSVGEHFLDRAIVSIVSGSLKSLALAAILLIVFYVTLTKPLSSLASQLTNLNLRDHPGDRIQLPEYVDVEELQTIAQATNSHLQLIEKHVQEVDAARHALRETNEGLEQKIQDRTQGLTHEIEERVDVENKLRQALKAAEANAVAKSQFLANMSHELRTPLNAIIGYSEFLTYNPNHFDAEKRQEYLAHIRDSGHHLLALVNNILDLSRLSAGKMPVNIEKVDVNELTREAATYLEPLAEKNNNTVILKFNSDVREILTDEVRLKQVLINLVGNAAKFTKNGQITLASSYCSQDNQIVCISVKDTGIGIPSETLNTIFDDFTQADSRLSRNFEGSGLGLSIVRETCDLLGWKIVVESTPEKGSQFTIKIPTEHPRAA